ncbi:MAG: hypothetical protein ACREL5_04850 [Gemmatimonadales bacterium]
MAVLLLAGLAGRAGAQWRLEAWFGDAWNLPSKVTFSQAGQSDISTTGHWSTRPFEPTWYYAGRVSKWSGNSAWAFEYMHHKIYLDDPPAGVRSFRITNGVNFLLGERLWRRNGWEFGAGAGLVFVVPVSSVRGQSYDYSHGIFDSDYELGGGGIELNVARRVRLLPYLYASFSLKSTAAYLHVKIANGHANTFNVALHGQYGLSIQAGR